jgi:hypothetical protein
MAGVVMIDGDPIEAGKVDDRAWLRLPAGRPVSVPNAISSVTYVLPVTDFDAAIRESETPLSY